MRKAPCEPGFSTAGPVSAATGACGPRLRRPSCRPARALLLIPCCLVACALPTPQPADPQAHAQQLLSASAELDSTWVPAEADRWRYRQWRRQMQARNPDLQAARAQWRAVQTAEAQAGLRRNPRLALTLERVVDGPVAIDSPNSSARSAVENARSGALASAIVSASRETSSSASTSAAVMEPPAPKTMDRISAKYVRTNLSLRRSGWWACGV